MKKEALKNIAMYGLDVVSHHRWLIGAMILFALHLYGIFVIWVLMAFYFKLDDIREIMALARDEALHELTEVKVTEVKEGK
jgi:hypothetical protein